MAHITRNPMKPHVTYNPKKRTAYLHKGRSRVQIKNVLMGDAMDLARRLTGMGIIKLTEK